MGEDILNKAIIWGRRKREKKIHTAFYRLSVSQLPISLFYFEERGNGIRTHYHTLIVSEELGNKQTNKQTDSLTFINNFYSLCKFFRRGTCMMKEDLAFTQIQVGKCYQDFNTQRHTHIHTDTHSQTHIHTHIHTHTHNWYWVWGGHSTAFWPCSLNILWNAQLDSSRKISLKFQLNPSSCLVGVVVTRYVDLQTEGQEVIVE